MRRFLLLLLLDTVLTARVATAATTSATTAIIAATTATADFTFSIYDTDACLTIGVSSENGRCKLCHSISNGLCKRRLSSH